MNTEKYRAFVTAVDCGSLTGAARRLDYTQSGISHMIASLESEYQLPLLVRSKNGVALTESGEKLLPLFRKIIDAEEEICGIVANAGNTLVGKLQVGGFFSVMTEWAPEIVKYFAKRYPEVSLVFSEGEIDEQLAMLRRGQIDVGIFSAPCPEEYDFIPLIDDPAVAVLPVGHVLAQKDILSPEELLDFPLLLQHDSTAEEIRCIFGQHYAQLSGQYKIRCDSAIVKMVSEGLGVGISSLLLVKQYSADVVIRYFDKDYHRTMGIVLPRKSHNALVKHFVAAMCDLFQEDPYKNERL